MQLPDRKRQASGLLSEGDSPFCHLLQILLVLLEVHHQVKCPMVSVLPEHLEQQLGPRSSRKPRVCWQRFAAVRQTRQTRPELSGTVLSRIGNRQWRTRGPHLHTVSLCVHGCSWLSGGPSPGDQ